MRWYRLSLSAWAAASSISWRMGLAAFWNFSHRAFGTVWSVLCRLSVIGGGGDARLRRFELAE